MNQTFPGNPMFRGQRGRDAANYMTNLDRGVVQHGTRRQPPVLFRPHSDVYDLVRLLGRAIADSVEASESATVTKTKTGYVIRP